MGIDHNADDLHTQHLGRPSRILAQPRRMIRHEVCHLDSKPCVGSRICHVTVGFKLLGRRAAHLLGPLHKDKSIYIKT